MIPFNEYVTEQVEQFNDGMITEMELARNLCLASTGSVQGVATPKRDETEE